VEAALLLARGAATWRAVEPDGVRAESAWRRALAIAPACEPVRRAWEAFCVDTGRHEDLIASVREDVRAAGDAAASHRQWRLGNLLERRLTAHGAELDEAARAALGSEALAAYEAAARDPAAAPAAEAVLRLLQAQGRWADVVAFLDARVERLDDPTVVVTVLYRMGETCEGPLEDPANARVHYERCLDVSPGYLPALEGLERVCSRTKAWDALAAVYEQRALLSDAPQQVALHRQRAGSVYEVRLGDANRAREQYRLALEAVPDFAPSLDAYARALTELGDWATLAKVLRNAASATRDSNEAVSLYYRAARVLVDRVGDVATATECLDRCLALSPAFAPALLLAKDISGAARGWDAYADFERAQASSAEQGPRRAWRLYAAATAYLGSRGDDAAAIAQSLLDENPAHEGAATVAQIVAVSRADVPAAVALYARLGASDSPFAPEWRARAAQLAASAGNAMELHRVVLDGGSAAPRLVASAALQLQLVEDASRAMEDGNRAGGADALRLRTAIRGLAPDVEQVLAERVAAGDTGAARLAIELRAGCRGAAHRLVAAGLSGVAASSHLVMAAEAFEELGAAAEAGAAWRAAFELDPRAGRAFDGTCAVCIEARDAEGVRALYARLPSTEQDGLGEALAAAGDTDGAIATWMEALTSADEPLPWQIRIEGGLEEAGRWPDLFRALKVRMDATSDDETRVTLGGRCRWLLAEKLAETDDAWQFYRDLHASDPSDRSVLEALARIAGARGDETLAIRYFTQLADTATDVGEAARIQRRVAEIRERVGDIEGARAALTRALDVLPEDREALAGLRRLATDAGDWRGVIGVLSREAALEGAVGRLAKAVEIAGIWEERLDDPRVAMESWAKVLEMAPDDRNALEHLVGLADRTRDAQAFVVYGKPLSEQLAGPERSALQSRIGMRLADDLRRDDEAVGWLDAATSGEHVDAAAAERLEAIHAARGAWDRVVDAILRRARATTDAGAKVEALRRAARIAGENARDKALTGRVFGMLLELDPENVDAVRYRADACFDAGDDAAALPLLERLEVHERSRDLDDFDTQVEVALYYYRYAETLRRIGRTEEAVARYERALELSPAHLPSLEAVGPIYVKREDWKAAEKAYQKLLQLTGGLGDADQLTRLYTNLGRVELRLGQTDKARKRLVKALELRPNDVPALQAYGEVLYAAGEWSPLLVTYNNIIYYTQTPADVIDAYLRKGYILDTKMNLPPREPGMVPEGAARAAQHYEKSLAFDPAQPEALLRLAELALRREDWAEAGSYADRGLAVESAPIVRACLLLARAVASQGTGDVGVAEHALAEIREHDAGLAAQVGATPVTDIATLSGILNVRVTASPKLG
jgi:tetratricopeptide (TPR) repeat protein